MGEVSEAMTFTHPSTPPSLTFLSAAQSSRVQVHHLRWPLTVRRVGGSNSGGGSDTGSAVGAKAFEAKHLKRSRGKGDVSEFRINSKRSRVKVECRGMRESPQSKETTGEGRREMKKSIGESGREEEGGAPNSSQKRHKNVRMEERKREKTRSAE